jgi:cardiolipin synthase
MLAGIRLLASRVALLLGAHVRQDSGGSTNLNIASWLGNYELDVVAADRPFAGLMETMYLEDLTNATEVVLDSRNRIQAPPRTAGRAALGASGSAGRAAAGLLCVGNTVGAAISDHRELGPVEVRIMIAGAMLLLTFGSELPSLLNEMVGSGA